MTLRRIYLDANGSSPSLKAAREKLIELSLNCGNPSSSHDHGRNARAVIDDARAYVAAGIGAREKEVIFTSGASEANRLFVDALVGQSRATFKIPTVLMSPFEHPSLLKPLCHAHDLGQINLKIFDVTHDGELLFTPTDLSSCDVVVISSAHNETGILPKLSKMFTQIPAHVVVMSDISQAYARIKAPPSRIDVMTFSAQKMGAFAGVGGIVLRGNAKEFSPPWTGGGQERGFRPGTESTMLIGAFGAAAKNVEDERCKHAKLESLRDDFEQQLLRKANIKIVGKNVPRLPNTSAVTFFGKDRDAIRIACDLAGLSVGFGSACSGLAPEGSFLLKRLGLNLSDEKSTVRFSFPSTTTKADIDEAIARLTTIGLANA